MGKPGAFLDIDRVTHELRPVEERSRDFDPLYVELDDDARRAQASRCMMCGVAFCQMGASFGKARPSGCPLHNLIPEWNELVYRGRWDEAAERLVAHLAHARVHEPACAQRCARPHATWVRSTASPRRFTIMSVRSATTSGPTAVRAALSRRGRARPRLPVVGSGPAGLAAAWELAVVVPA